MADQRTPDPHTLDEEAAKGMVDRGETARDEAKQPDAAAMSGADAGVFDQMRKTAREARKAAQGDEQHRDQWERVAEDVEQGDRRPRPQR